MNTDKTAEQKKKKKRKNLSGYLMSDYFNTSISKYFSAHRGGFCTF